MMYITKIHLNNVRCFEDVVIDLNQCEQGNSVLLAGNNGTGKSAIIRAIAMGLCDRDSAAALLRELSGDFVKLRDNKDEANRAVIKVELYDSEAEQGKQQFIIKTTITEYPGILGETVQQKIIIPHLENREILIPEGLDDVIADCKNPESGLVDQGTVAQYIPWINTFVSGYGPGLRTFGTTQSTEYFAPDALYSIFNYSSPLQDPETAWRRLIDAARKNPANKDAKEAEKSAQSINNKVSKLIHGVIGLGQDDQVVLESNGIFIKDSKRNNELIELDAKGDGHKSLAKVLLDILIWYLLFDNYDEKKQGELRSWRPLEIIEQDGLVSVPNVKGIVIIDEIEQHLHPTLQRKVIKSLSEKLPNVQFIIATHSPLCLSGACDLSEADNHAYKIYSVFKEEGGASIQEKDLPYGLRADQILVDYFDLTSTVYIRLQNKIDRLRELFSKDTLEEAEQVEYETLDRELRSEAPFLAEREDDRRQELERDKATQQMMDLLIKRGVLKDDPIKKRT